MKRKLFGSSEQDDKNDHNSTAASADKKRRRKNAVDTPKHYPKSERQQLALVLQMTSVENSPEPASPPPSAVRKTPGGSGRKDKIHKRNERGETSLHLCTIRGDLDAMKELVRLGADVNVQDFAGWTPLHEACNHGHHEITRYLLQNGANVNSKGLEDDTPLHDAVTNSHRDLVELLLKYGANPLLKNKRGERPLDIAEDLAIKELMATSIANKENGDYEHDCSSPSRSEDSDISGKSMIKIQSTNTYPSVRTNLYDKTAKKKLEASPFSHACDSSSCGSCDEKTTAKKPNSYGSALYLNGYRTPTSSVSSNAMPKRKKKRKSSLGTSDKISRVKTTPNKALTDTSSSSSSSSSASSSDTSSDSDSDDDHGLSKNGLPIGSLELKKHKSLKNNPKDHTKRKSLFPNDKSHLSDSKATTQRAEQTSKKKLTQFNHPNSRSRSLSYEEVKPALKSVHKGGKPSQEVQKTSPTINMPALNGFKTFSNSRNNNGKHGVDDSIYDFSPSTEDLTAARAISLKQNNYKNACSELFDVVCLGKPYPEINSGSIPCSDTKDDPNAPDAVRLMPKDDSKSSISAALKKEIAVDDKSHDKLEEGDKSYRRTPQTPTAPKTNGPQSLYNHISSKVEKPFMENKKNSAIEKDPVVTISSTSDEISQKSVKSEKKVKKYQSSAASPRKLANGPVMSVVKQDSSIPKKDTKLECKSELATDVKSEKKRKLTVEGETRISTTEKSSLLPSKKKKKRKRKHSHEAIMGEQKHRHRTISNDQPSSEKFSISDKDKASLPPNSKSVIKRHDSTKSLHSTPRKISQDGKSEAASVSVKKKVRSTDSTGSETSVKSSKYGNSNHKSLKSTLSGSTQDRSQLAPLSTKKDKPEPKKISLLTDANSSFLSELEKSSRHRAEQERKLKIQRKRKIQQLKAEAALKEAKQNTALSDKPAVNVADKPIQDFGDSSEPIAGRRTSVSASPVGSMFDRSFSQSGYSCQNNFGSPFREQPNALGNMDSVSVFKPTQFPPMRSISQVDQKGTPLEIKESWNRTAEKNMPLIQHDKKHVTAHRSLSFSGPPSDSSTPVKTVHDTLSSSDSQNKLPRSIHDGVHRHSLVESPHRPSNYSSGPVVLPAHPINGPSLPPANNQPQQSSVPIAQTPQKPALLAVEGSLPNSAYSGGIGHSSPSTPSNVPISSPMVATKVSDHFATATQPTGTTSNVTAVLPDQAKSCISAEAKPETPKTRKTDDEQDTECLQTTDTNPDEGDACAEKELAALQPNLISEEQKARELAEKEKEERKLALENYISNRLSKLDTAIEERIPKRLPVFIPMEKLKTTAGKDPLHDRLNVYEEWTIIQKQICERRKKCYTAVVIPQTPNCYLEYMSYTGTYLLGESKESWLSVPVLAPPPSLGEEMRALFVEHEKERVKLRLQHATQREKLIVACEQEIMRVHTRAARMLQNQQVPLSACSVFLDREVYNLERRNKRPTDENATKTSIRDRFNGRMMLSWLQDVDDKYVRTKNVLLTRQKNESQALHAVQRTEWFLKLQEVESQGQQKRWSNSKPEDVSELYVPLVNISDDFPLLPG